MALGSCGSVLDPTDGCQVETFTCALLAAWSALPGQLQQRLEQRVGAPLDRLPVAHLVRPVAAPAPGGDEEHPGVGHRRQVLGVVARPRRHALVAELELLA